MRTIAVINQKGGCGKTTTAINLAGVFASRALRTLLVDVDPQSHCAAGLAIPEQRIDLDIGDAMLEPSGFDPSRLLWRVSRNLDLAPSRMKLAGLEASRGGLADRAGKDRALASVLERLSPSYDACCIDCPPGIGLLTYNALVAADTVIIPVETSYFSLRGAAKQIDTIKSLARRLGIQTPYWLLATIHDETSALARDLLSELRREFDSRVCPVVIRADAALKEASSFGQSVVDYAPDSGGAADYEALATWIMSQSVRTSEGQPATHEDGPPVVHVSPVAGRAMLEPRNSGNAEQVELKPEGGGFASPQHAPPGAPMPPASPDFSMPSGTGPAGMAHGAAGSTGASPAGHGIGASQDAGGPGVGPQPSPIEITPTSAVIVEAERALSRTEDLVRRALLLQRSGVAEAPRPAPVELMVDDESHAAPPEPPTQISRLLGVRQTQRGVLFVQPLSIGRSVAVAGDFNQWNPAGHEMRANKGLGVYELLVPIAPGTYSYRLVIDGVWKPDPFNPATQPNPYGEPNSVLRVSADTPKATRLR